MIDPIQLPLLLKAIDFVFEEGHKILEERRERRKTQEKQEIPSPTAIQAPPQTEIAEPAKEVAEVPVKEPTRQELLASKIDEIRWQNHEMEVQHLVRLLETYTRNYQLAKEQYAKWGSALVPPIIVSNLNEAENCVFETIQQLEVILSKVYQKEIHPAI